MNPKILHVHVKYVYFNQVKNKEKDEEYREIKPYWNEKLNKDYDEIHYHAGYNHDKDSTLIFRWNGYKKKRITHELFGKNKLVYAIPLKEDSDILPALKYGASNGL